MHYILTDIKNVLYLYNSHLDWCGIFVIIEGLKQLACNTLFLKTSQFHMMFFLLKELVCAKSIIYFHTNDQVHAIIVWTSCMILFMCIAL